MKGCREKKGHPKTNPNLTLSYELQSYSNRKKNNKELINSSMHFFNSISKLRNSIVSNYIRNKKNVEFS